MTSALSFHFAFIMLHGMGGTALNLQQEAGWSVKADSEGLIVVYPDELS